MIIVGTHLDIYNKATKKKRKKEGNVVVHMFQMEELTRDLAESDSTALDELLGKIQSRYKRRFPNVMGVMAVSTKTKRGVKVRTFDLINFHMKLKSFSTQELQARIAEIAEKKKYVGQQVPTPYYILTRQVEILTKTKSPPIMVRSYSIAFNAC